MVHGDEALLGEMLDNLIDNALRYTRPKGAVTVRCGVDAAGAFFSVEDNGIGIPQAERAKVFERFYRGAGVGGDGSGLGLAIVKEGAQRHGAVGAIAVPASGTGTVASVRFPANANAGIDSVALQRTVAPSPAAHLSSARPLEQEAQMPLHGQPFIVDDAEHDGVATAAVGK